ncbi:unnamed protein product [Symbiodinium microadriaticum]|nr:unnamed protein product [Symbiodinium microadriaticum]
MPSGEPWECGLQLQQWISEFTTVASCVALEFNQYFLQQLETAKSRYDARQIQLKPEDIEAPPVPSHCEEMENRLSLTLMRVLPEQLRKPVMEQSAGQRVSSVRMLEGVFERFIPGGVEEKTSLYRFLRALPSASGFKDLLATLRRMKLARTRAATLGLPGIAPHELVASVNAMTKKLEGKHASLATRLNLLRLSPELIVPSEAGLNTLVATLETEARRMGAEEDVRTSRSGTGTEDYEYTVAAQLKGKGLGVVTVADLSYLEPEDLLGIPVVPRKKIWMAAEAINGGHITVDDMPDVWEWEENQIQNPSYAWLKSGQREVNFANLLPIWFWWTRELIKFFVQLDRGIVVKS